jgi:hypothetical protein
VIVAIHTKVLVNTSTRQRTGLKSGAKNNEYATG